MKRTRLTKLVILLAVISVMSTTGASAQSRRGYRNVNFGNRLKMMMEQLDSNKDGVVTQDEFKGSKNRFSRMDHNGDGKIDGTELTAMQQWIRKPKRSGDNPRGGDVLTQRHGADKSPKVGQKAPDFTLKLLHSEEEVTLSKTYRDKPVVLTLGSYTCPPFRNAIEGIDELSQQYGEEFAFCFVYIKEAHATDERPSRGNQRMGIEYTQPTTYVEREKIALTCQQQIELTMPILVDTIDNVIERLYAGAPNRTYLIDQDGIILYKGVRGPQGTRPQDVSQAMQKLSRSLSASQESTFSRRSK